MKLLTLIKGGCLAAFLSFFFSNATAVNLAYNMAGNLKAYPYLDEEPPAQTPPPSGYVPFHIEHYGRHGSRWLIGPGDYLAPVRNLEKAEKAGKLTPLGQKTLDHLRKVQKASVKREGELTDIGALQHKAIGKRMALNYPEIFNEDAQIDAKSTIVIRCILSMSNALQGISEVAPGIKPSIDASMADMWFMNFDDKTAWPVKDSAENKYYAPYRKSLFTSDNYLDRLVSDPVFARDSVAPGLLPYLYWVLANARSHSDQEWLIEEVFPADELEANWKSNNAYWFIHGGHTTMTGGRMPYTQRKLLTKMIELTDSAIANGSHGANLRFGHDGILLNLVTLMEVGGYGRRIDSLDDLEKSGWHEYDIIPMAGNLQLVFYKPQDSDNPEDVLVKALLNEKEMTLPGEPVEGPYYSWPVLKAHYLERLGRFWE